MIIKGKLITRKAGNIHEIWFGPHQLGEFYKVTFKPGNWSEWILRYGRQGTGTWSNTRYFCDYLTALRWIRNELHPTAQTRKMFQAGVDALNK